MKVMMQKIAIQTLLSKRNDLIRSRLYLVTAVLTCIFFNAGCATHDSLIGANGKARDAELVSDESLMDACGSESQTKKDQPIYVPVGEYAVPIASAVQGAADELGSGITGKLRAFQLYTKALAAKLKANEQFYHAMPACEEKGDCLETVVNNYFQEVSTSADSLALLAASSRDADIYAAAFYHCQEKKTDACSVISSNNWAVLDPDNAVPWIYAAAEAKIRNDDVALDNALKNAAERAAFNSRVPNLSLILYAQGVRSKDTVTRITISNTLTGEYQMLQGFKYLSFHQYCVAEFMNTQNRSISCEKIADLISKHAKDLDDLGIASAIGEKANWPNERTEKLKAEQKLLRQFIGNNSTYLNLASCGGAYMQRKLVTSLFEKGELVTFRTALIERK